MKYNVLIGGAAGQGLDTLSRILEKILQKQGYYVFTNKDYMSRIRGGHNFIQVRFGDEKIFSHDPQPHLILALNTQTYDKHREKLRPDGFIIADEKLNLSDEALRAYPFSDYMQSHKNNRLLTSLLIGAVLKHFGLSMDYVSEVFKDIFKTDELITVNMEACAYGYESSPEVFQAPKAQKQDMILISGNEATALGAIAAGLSYYSAYPMTPATGIMNYLTKKQKEAGFVVEQAEDEIAAISAAMGASYAGVRAMTGTSGGGFALMVEHVSFIGVAETPLVVVDVQRPGPATGLPTRTAQGDLNMMLGSGHGEFPKLVTSLTDVESAFYDMQRAFNMADRYQLPVLVLSDQYLADATVTLAPFDFHRIPIARHLSPPELIPQDYQRYAVTENGISPRYIPGQTPDAIHLADSHEHDPYGHPTEDVTKVLAQMEKRMRKLQTLTADLLEPEHIGDQHPDILLIAWGSTGEILREAIQEMQAESLSIGALIFKDLYPLPQKKLMALAPQAKKIINVEHNMTGQFGKLITMETGLKMDHSILKYDGRQLNFKEMIQAVKEVI